MENPPDKLFQTFPLTGEREISTGRVPVPYHVYDGHGMLIGGTVPLARVRPLLADERVYPLPTKGGYALMAIWVCDFQHASLGPHNELQFSFLVTPTPTLPIEDHPLSVLQALISDPEVYLYCHGLWNDTAVAVAYNRELLGLPAQLNQADMKRRDGRKTFTFTDADGSALIHGQINEDKRTGVKLVLELMRFFGFRRALEISSAPYLAAKVVNPIGPHFPENLAARAFIATRTPVLQRFDPAREILSLQAAPYRRLNFTPQFVEHFVPFRFVYLMPEPITDNADDDANPST